MAHAKGMVDRLRLAIGQLISQLIKIDIIFVHKRIDFAERQKLVFLRQTQHFVHRTGPKYAAAGEIPIPQSAASPVKRGIDATADGVIDDVGLACARGLPMEGEAQDQHHETGGRQ